MATRELLSPAQRLRLTELPDPMDERELARHHTLSDADLRVVGKRRRPDTRLGFSVQLCYLRFPGRPLRAGERPPENLLGYVAAQLGESTDAFEAYALRRDTTRREHLREIIRTFGFRPFDAQARRELFGFLLPVAMGTDRGRRSWRRPWRRCAPAPSSRRRSPRWRSSAGRLGARPASRC